MSPPKSFTDCLKALQAERATVQTRLDAIELALDNLTRIWEVAPTRRPRRRKAPRAVTERRQTARRQVRTGPVGVVKGHPDDVQRRETLLSVIGRSEVGCTIADLRKATPKMDGAARSRAIQQLKAQRLIRRAGNAWVKAA